MEEELTLSLVRLVMGLLFVASLVSVTARKLRFPFTIGLVIIGLFMGWASRSLPVLEPVTSFRLTPEVVLLIFLPVLLFEAAFRLDARSLIKNLLPISLLAVPALLVSTAVTGFIVHYALGLPLGLALLFGSLISATDPVAVVALFKEMGAPKRLHLLVEGESLFNDGTSLVVFKIILGVVLAGTFTGATVAQGVLQFVTVASAGIAVGIAMGVFFAWIIGSVENDPLVEITLTTILAHSTFITAEHLLHVSGVMATVAAGLTMGSYGRSKISPPVVGHLESAWSYFAFVCNSLIFLLVGLSIDLSLLAHNIRAVLIGALAALFARGLSVYGVFTAVEGLRLAEHVSRGFQTVISWGGLRGALAIVMALSIPHEMPEKPFLLALTLGVVLTSLLLNGLTVRPLISLLGLDRYTLKERFERVQAMLEVKEATREKLLAFTEEQGIDPLTARSRESLYRSDITALERELEEIRKGSGGRDESEVVLRHSLLLEKKHYQRLFEEGMLGEGNLKDMQLAIDRQLDRLKEGLEVYRPGRPPLSVRIFEAIGNTNVLQPLARRHRERRAARRYEVERARFFVSTPVLRDLAKLAKHKTISEAAYRRAEELYSGLRQKALSRLEALREEHPELEEKVEENILRRFSLNTELEAYRELYARGSIPEKMLDDMERHIREKLRKMKPAR